MERTSGSPEVTIGLIDGPVVTQHRDLAGEHLREIPGSNGTACVRASSTACLHGTFVAGILSAKRNSPAPAICPRLHAPRSPHFCRSDLGPRTHAECDAEGTRRGDHRMHRRRCSRHQPEPRPRATFHQRGAVLGRSAQSGRQARRDRRGGGGQSGHHRQFRHHPPSVGHPRRGLRHSRQTNERVESGRFDRQAGPPRTRRRHYQPRRRRTQRSRSAERASPCRL